MLYNEATITLQLSSTDWKQSQAMFAPDAYVRFTIENFEGVGRIESWRRDDYGGAEVTIVSESIERKSS